MRPQPEKTDIDSCRIIRPRELQALLAISPATLWRWARRPDFPPKLP